MAKLLKFQRRGVVEATLTMTEDGKCLTQHTETLTPHQKRQLAEALRRLARALLNRT